ncbi:MAG TPA: membrane protein insertase YidC [Bacteroidetes bacterium]|nr:membrane protein insertase YidC [Bacteroidota bacterium]
MDRNTVVGLLLIGLLFVIFSYYNSNQRNKAYEQELHTADSLYQVRKYQQARTSYLKALVYKPSEIYPRRKVMQIDSLLQAERPDTLKNKNASDALQKNLATTEKERLTDTTAVVSKQGEILPTEKQKFITIENDLLKIRLSTLGGMVYSAELKKFKTWDGKPVVLFHGDSTEFGFRFFTNDNQLIDTKRLFFTPVTDTGNIVVTDSSYTAILRLKVGENEYMDYRYTIFRNEYMIYFDVDMHSMDNLIARNLTDISLKWKIYMPQQEKGRTNEDFYSTIKFKYYQDVVDGLPMRSKKPELSKDITTKLIWVAFKDQFFSSVIISDSLPFLNGTIKSLKMPDESPYFRECETELSVPYQPKKELSYHMRMYFGPNHFKTLKKYGMDLQDLVFLGRNIIRWINQFVIIPIFNWLNLYISNYGIIILLLTLIIKTALFPLTYKSYVSQAKMKVLKPYMDEINAKYPKKEDAMKKQQATMALYKRAGIKPMGGCLPMILQLPILYAMFRFFPTSIELRQQSFLWAHDLSTYDSILQLPFVIPMYGDHVSLFTILMTASTIITMKINSPSGSSSQMPGMKGMMYIMPITFMLFLNNFSAALNYYYFLANLITFGQNMLAKSFIKEEEILKKLKENKNVPVKKSKWQQRMEEAAKARGYRPPKKRR